MPLEKGVGPQKGWNVRSFSRTREATNNYADGHDGDGAIIRTKNTPHYNITKFDEEYYYEAESLVDTSNLKVTKITKYDLNDYPSKEEYYNAVRKELGVKDDVKQSTFPETMTFYDVEPV